MSELKNFETQKSYKYLQEVEELAQDILTIKDTKLQLANAQNKFREALAALESVEDRNNWIKVGSVYVKRPVDELKEILKLELSKVQTDLDNLHDDLKTKTHKLRDLEHEPRLEGFSLKPMSIAEAKALHKGFGLA